MDQKFTNHRVKEDRFSFDFENLDRFEGGVGSYKDEITEVEKPGVNVFGPYLIKRDIEYVHRRQKYVKSIGESPDMDPKFLQTPDGKDIPPGTPIVVPETGQVIHPIILEFDGPLIGSMDDDECALEPAATLEDPTEGHECPQMELCSWISEAAKLRTGDDIKIEDTEELPMFDIVDIDMEN